METEASQVQSDEIDCVNQEKGPSTEKDPSNKNHPVIPQKYLKPQFRGD